MKKNIGIILIIAVFIILYLVIKPIRTTNVLLKIAQREFQNIPMYDSLRLQLIGPSTCEKENFVEFKWYKVLDWGDTSAIYIDVYKFPSSFTLRDNFFNPRITMNYQWYYFLFPNGTSKFVDVFPYKFKDKTLLLSSLQLFPNQAKYYENSEVFIRPDRLFYFLKNGYFEVLEKKDEYTLVGFYEPIGNVFINAPNNVDTINTMAAKVLINDAFEVLIIPYHAPSELWGQDAKYGIK